MARKQDALKFFSPTKLRRLIAGRPFYVVAADIGQCTGVSISPEALRKYVDGDSTPGGEKLALLAAYFGIGIDDLFE